MVIITKKQADEMLVNSLFKPVNGKTLSIMKYDCGKYKGTPKEFIGKYAQPTINTYAIYPISRKDKDGRYTQLMCLTTN